MVDDIGAKRSKKWDVNKPRKGNTKDKNVGIIDGEAVDKKTIKLGRTVPDILIQDTNRKCYRYRRSDRSIIDECVRQKVKKTLDDEMSRLGITKDIYFKMIKEPVGTIKNIPVVITKTEEKGWVIIVKRKFSFDVIRDTNIIVKYLEKNGIYIKDEDICTGFCPLTKLDEEESVDELQ
jgi:hypothetical protein